MNKKISVSFPKNLISHIETEIEGNSRNEKVCKCVAKGYEILTNNGSLTENARRTTTH